MILLLLFKCAWSNLRNYTWGFNSGRPWLGREECWLAPYKIFTYLRCLLQFPSIHILLSWSLSVSSSNSYSCGNFLYTGGKDSLVKLWDAKLGRELCSLWVYNLDICSSSIYLFWIILEKLCMCFAVTVTKMLYFVSNGIKMVTGYWLLLRIKLSRSITYFTLYAATTFIQK